MTQGERIKELRKSLGLTLEKFGERLGVGKTAISKLEKGERNLTDQMFKSICREFNVNEEWLRDGTGDMEAVKLDDFTSAIVQIDKGDPKARQVILNYLNMSQQDKDLFWTFLDKLVGDNKNRKD